jgi:hypothetical protein
VPILLKERPVFIVGQERSGTTLLMVMLGQHTRIAVPEVAWWYPRFRAYLHTYGDLARDDNLRTLASEMAFGLMVPFWGMPENPRTIVDEILSSLRERSFAGIYCAMLERYASFTGKPRWGEKTPNNVFFVPAILEDFPQAQFLCVTRDARDMAADAIRSSFGPTNAYVAAHEWRFGQRTIQHLRKSLPRDVWFDVRYESLARDPEGTLRAVCAFLGEPYEAGMLEFHRGDIARRRGRHRDHGPLAEPVSARYIGIYREQLSIRDQRIIAAIAGSEMEAEGYRSDVAPLHLDEGEQAYQEELDGRMRAAMLDGPIGRASWESYNDWLADQRDARKAKGIWSDADVPSECIVGHPFEELMTGVRAPRKWKQHFCFKRQY